MSKPPKQPKPPKVQKPIENLTGLLDRICSLVDCATVPLEQVETVKLRAVFDTIGRRAYGPLLLAIGLFAVSPLTAVPGATWASAALTLVVAGQLMLGMQRPWMPRRLLDMEIASGALVKGVEAARPWARRIDLFLKPRLDFLARPPFVIVIGALCVAAAILTFPLGFIPLAPLAPGAAVVLFGLGLVAKDGFLLAFGAGAVAAAGWLLYRLFDRIAGFLPFF